ncbi:serine hydrolase domain-containing protein [Streptacidiphilus fuscans]|uniref:Beta-lactamase family protein n=1 Tax=Streptacidiphilus fuscans TaxID=2789292 RepID=A0A931B5K0_9ACTN|nr:serine hydrolase domain-containing protein [Streptacidiphilus fuscans]MBF9069057.1 beta-lactamase family protein [Streptacidiphilus fuscans]
MSGAAVPGLGRATPEDVGLSTVALERVDAAVQKRIDGKVIAGALTLVARHGKIVRTSSMGVDDRRTGKRLATDTIVRIFSMTKPVTGIAMGILADRGLWSPNDPIAQHLPELADLKVCTGFDRQGRPTLETAAHPPTVAELLTHTAGFVYGSKRTDRIGRLYARHRLLRSRSTDEFLDRLRRLPLAYQPGTQWRYSLAMDIQGALIERLTGQSLPDFFQQHIFQPLGMVDTAFHTPPHKLSRRARLYYTGGPFHLLKGPNVFSKDFTRQPDFALGGMGLVSTLDDYTRFAQLLLNRGQYAGQRIVSADSVTAQMTNHLPQSLLTQGFRAGHMHIRPGFGFGWNGAVVHDPQQAGLPVGRGTYLWDGAAGTWFWADPEHDLLYIGLIQLLSYTAPPLQALTQRLMADAILD